jgi:hypothetical protein
MLKVMYLIMLVVEMLAINIRNAKNIKGIKLRSKEIKISQLADDTTLILESCESIKHVKELLYKFELIAGLNTNMEKTQAFMIGKHIKRFKNDYNLTWKDGPVHILGLHICESEIESIKYNFEPRLKKIRTVLNMWRQRKLSLKGKVTVINSLAASLLVYPCTTLDTPEHIIKETDKIFCEFLWNGKVNKIARNTVIKQIEQGGLKMTDMTSKIKSIKMTWVKRAINNPTSS